MRFASFPFDIEPTRWPNSKACAAFMVTALKASLGVIFIWVHARDIRKGIFPEGVEPGL